MKSYKTQILCKRFQDFSVIWLLKLNNHLWTNLHINLRFGNHFLAQTTDLFRQMDYNFSISKAISYYE